MPRRTVWRAPAWPASCSRSAAQVLAAQRRQRSRGSRARAASRRPSRRRRRGRRRLAARRLGARAGRRVGRRAAARPRVGLAHARAEAQELLDRRLVAVARARPRRAGSAPGAAARAGAARSRASCAGRRSRSPCSGGCPARGRSAAGGSISGWIGSAGAAQRLRRQARCPTAAGPAPSSCPSRSTTSESTSTPSAAQLKMPSRSYLTACSRQLAMSSSWMNCTRGSKPRIVGIDRQAQVASATRSAGPGPARWRSAGP